jgi:hypothetical protein
MAPQAPGVFCISPWGAHAHFAPLAQPHLLARMRNRCQPWCIWPAIGGKVSGLDQLHRQPRFLAGGGKALIHGGE